MQANMDLLVKTLKENNDFYKEENERLRQLCAKRKSIIKELNKQLEETTPKKKKKKEEDADKPKRVPTCTKCKLPMKGHKPESCVKNE
jgi:hypothetical protein